jgi:ABC-type arginine/histidine transport system permease subunit
MKYKTVKLLLPIVCLGFFVAILVAFARSAKSSSDKLPLNEVWTFQADGRILATPILIDHQIIFRTADKIY